MSYRHFFKTVHHASLYAKHRPVLPTFVADNMMKYMKDKKCNFDFLLDVGCGSGQSTHAFSSYFTNLLGVDTSKSQIAVAEQLNTKNHVSFKIGDSENLPVSNENVDLVLCSMTIYWLEFLPFFKECQRILKPRGCLLMCGHDWPTLYPKSNGKKSVNEMIEIGKKEVVKYAGYLPFHERASHMRDHYRRIFEMVKSNHKVRKDNLIDRKEMQLADYVLYLSTWSPYQRFFRENEESAIFILEQFASNVKQGWGMPDTKNEDITVVTDTVYYMIMTERPEVN